MRSRPLALAVALVAAVGIVLPLAPTPAPQAAAAPAPIAQGTIVDRNAVADLSAVFNAINTYRSGQGLRPLRFMPQLHTIAQSWSYELGQTDAFKHRTGFTSLYPAGSSRSGEIIAWRRDANAAALVTQWINSPAHKAQLLGDYTAMGVGVATVDGYQGASRASLVGTTNFGRYVGSAQPTTYASVQAWVNAGGRVAPAPAPVPDAQYVRIAARDTMQASVDMSVQRNQPSRVTEVYLAPSHVYFEALSAAPAAARVDRALLLVEPSGPSQALLNELRRLNPGTVTLVGAPNVLPDATLRAVRSALPGKSVVRVAGSNAPEISANFALEEFPGADRVYVAAERNLSDVISASSAAAALGVPLVLTPRSTTIPSSITSYFAAERPSRVTVVGGSPQLASAQERAIERAGSGISATLVRERDRFLTNASTLRTAWSGPQDAAYLASALQFGHAFVGSAIAAGNGPVALTSIGCVPPGPFSFVTGSVDPQQVVALGMEWTVSANAAALGRCAS
ncbi:cell wall-binding repeat-containing protein [Agrococcus sp. ARC_14]|uniref:cell wall-binding repeat-containing protein n=1 Tax=Agrococcus sp. ARC_14 TaxID=2919927 RepID=UPI001F06DBF8|nr:cell wall-binding repeat-containing protein [Agrococcus sp. ARC_14]MCH1882084.1 cell wall-binding repeat-containing protein [Agrococcus sp. ARC_14]